MKIEIENLKSMVYQKDLNIYEKANAIEEFVRLLDYVNELEQLMLGGVGNSSDLIVVELSDDEIKIISEQELKEWQQSAIEFDGFESWIVRGLLVKNK